MGTPFPRVSPYVTSPWCHPDNYHSARSPPSEPHRYTTNGTGLPKWTTSPSQPSRPLTMCNHLHLTWKWMMGSPSILTSMLINYHTLSRTSNKLKWRTIALWHNFWQHLSATQNCNDCLVTSKTAIITEKVKMLSQQYSGFLLSIIKSPPNA